VLATRHDVRLGLHRPRLEGELAEIREPLTWDDARQRLAEQARADGASAGHIPGRPARNPPPATRSGA
jgi:LuxR family maltose regulon positive regulatory protein